MGQLIQIKRSTDNKASALTTLAAGELAYSTVEVKPPHYSQLSGAVESQIWIGGVNSEAREQIFSSSLIHAWDNDHFIMKGEGEGGPVTFGTTTVDSLQSTGAVSGTAGTFSGAVSGTTGTFSAALQGKDLTVTDGAISGGTADLSLTSTTKKVKLNELVFDGTSNGSSANNALVFDTATSTFKPGTIDVTASAKAAISALDDSLNYSDGAFSINTVKETERTTALIKSSINSVSLSAGSADSSMVYNTNSEKWDFTPSTKISLSSNSADALTLTDGVLKLDVSGLIAQSASTVVTGGLDGMAPDFGGLTVQPGTESNPATFSVGAHTNVFFGTNTLNNVATPTVGHQAATKEYVDSVATGLGVKKPVKASTVGDLTATYVADTSNSPATLTAISPITALTVDGVSIDTIQVGGSGGSTITTEADRVLVQNQTLKNQNGIYELTSVSPYVLTRASSADSITELSAGTFVFVEGGDTHVNKGFVVSSDFASNAVFGATDVNIVWSLFSSTGVIEADDVTTIKVGNEIRVKVDEDETIVATSEGLKVRYDTNKGIHLVNKALAVELNSVSPLTHNTGGITLDHDDTLRIINNELGVNSFGDHFVGTADLRIKLDSTGGLTSGTNGLNVNLDGAGALVTGTSGNIGIKKSSVAANAISVTTDGIHVKLREADTTSITLTDNKFSVKSAGITNDMLAGSIDLPSKVTGLLPKTSGGLGLNAVVSGILWGADGAYSAIANGTAGQIMAMVETTANSGVYVPGFATMDGGSF